MERERDRHERERKKNNYRGQHEVREKMEGKAHAWEEGKNMYTNKALSMDRGDKEYISSQGYVEICKFF